MRIVLSVLCHLQARQQLLSCATAAVNSVSTMMGECGAAGPFDSSVVVLRLLVLAVAGRQRQLGLDASEDVLHMLAHDSTLLIVCLRGYCTLMIQIWLPQCTTPSES